MTPTKGTLTKIISAIFVAFLALLVLPYFIDPIVHDFKMWHFSTSIRKIPVLDGFERAFQKEWFGILWACGNHADYLVVQGLRGEADDRAVYEHFNSDWPVRYPETHGNFPPQIYRLQDGIWYFIEDGEAHEGRKEKWGGMTFDEGNMFNDVSHRLLQIDVPKGEDAIYYIVYVDEGESNSDWRTH